LPPAPHKPPKTNPPPTPPPTPTPQKKTPPQKPPHPPSPQPPKKTHPPPPPTPHPPKPPPPTQSHNKKKKTNHPPPPPPLVNRVVLLFNTISNLTLGTKKKKRDVSFVGSVPIKIRSSEGEGNQEMGRLRFVGLTKSVGHEKGGG